MNHIIENETCNFKENVNTCSLSYHEIIFKSSYTWTDLDEAS